VCGLFESGQPLAFSPGSLPRGFILFEFLSISKLLYDHSTSIPIGGGSFRRMLNAMAFVFPPLLCLRLVSIAFLISNLQQLHVHSKRLTALSPEADATNWPSAVGWCVEEIS
jgi:hypothetical protein